MAYSDFDLRKAVTDFGLTTEEGLDLFGEVPPLDPGEHLREWIEEYRGLALGVGSEKARSEYLITPVFAEARRLAGRTFHVHPGVSFEVDRARGLAGVCDYLVTRSREIFFVRGPILAVAEGKKDNTNDGLGQCVAAMVAVRIFNEQDRTPIPIVHACVTTGNLWRFLRLDESRLTIDRTEYSLNQIPKILGILVHIAGDP